MDVLTPEGVYYDKHENFFPKGCHTIFSDKDIQLSNE